MTDSKIDSNVSGFRYAVEDTIGVLPVSGVVWYPLEPNSYNNFGGQYTKTARNPINSSRQRKKGVTTDLSSGGTLNVDVLQAVYQRDVFPAFFFAAMRTKAELASTATAATGSTYMVAANGTEFKEGDLLFAKGFDDAANNGLKHVSGTTAPTSTAITVTETLVDSSAQTGTISRVGFTFASGDAEIDASGTLPALTTTTKDLTELGVIPGEWVYIGGDSAGSQFATAADNGRARVRSVAAHKIEFDKSQGTLVTDTGTSKTIEIYVGRVLKNESDRTLQVRKTLQLERTLGDPDGTGTDQAEYVTGAVADHLTLTINTGAIMNMDMVFTGTGQDIKTSADGLKTGTRPDTVDEDGFNTATDVTQMHLSKVSDGTSLFAFATQLSIQIKNNASVNKAVGFLGGFDVSVGTFDVSGTGTFYLADIDALNSVKNNDDLSLDVHVVHSNVGFALDLPLITVGDARADVKLNQPVMLPVSSDAASGAKVDANLDHTLMMVFFDYLPNAAAN